MDMNEQWPARTTKRKELAGPPVAVHARRDHRAARPILLHVGRGAVAHRIGAGVVARIDVGRPLLPIDRHALRPAPPLLCGHIGCSPAGSLRAPQCRGCRRHLRLRRGISDQEPGKSSRYCDRHNPLHGSPPTPDIEPYGLRLARQGQLCAHTEHCRPSAFCRVENRYHPPRIML